MRHQRYARHPSFAGQISQANHLQEATNPEDLHQGRWATLQPLEHLL